MESGSGFSQDLGGDEDDPFAGSEEDFGLSEGEKEAQADAARTADAAMEAERGTQVADPALPVVDKEGEVVQAPVEPQPAADATQVAAEQVAASVAEESDPFGGATATEDGSPAAAQGAGVDPTPASEQPSGTSAASQPEPVSEPASAVAEPSAAATEDPPAAATGGEPSAAAEAAGEPGGTEEVAEPPAEKEGTKRQYKLFTPDGNGKFSEVVWYESKTGKVVEKGAPGAKKQTVVLARGQRDALSHGYTVMGAPQEGVSLVAVAATYWQVKHVQPDPVPPIRQRLKIA